jgi:hypothetical protein
MTTFGKVLAILNVLAALGFVALITMDYSQRFGQEKAVYLQDLVINGLPVDESEKTVNGDPAAELLGKNALGQIVSGGSAVTTQKAAVQQRHTQLMAAVDAATGKDKQDKVLALVLPFCHSASERAAIRDEIQHAKDDQLGSQGPYFTAKEKRYFEALDHANDPNQAPGNRREAMAHYLFCTSATPQDYQYALSICGLDHYSREVEHHGTALQSMVPELEAAMATDRGAFEAHHRTLIEQIVRLGDRIRRLQDDLEKQKAQIAQYQALIADRTRDVEDLQNRIKATTEALGVALTQQTDYEKALFEAQKTIAITSEANRKLDQEIKHRELGETKP